MTWMRWKPGWQPCSYTTKGGNSAAAEYPYQRILFHRAGACCRKLVSPETRQRLGVFVCGTHEPMFHADVKRDAELRQALRDKYDPGPLPNTGE